ncbi:hypothetical protein F4861DRAFT_335345 [Xylaria intraflava]|nr:hypothetical protein F4861DRAFT_335345 [Xylaria intraflava]
MLEEFSSEPNINRRGGLSAAPCEPSYSVGESRLFILAPIILQAGNKPHIVVLLEEVMSSIDTTIEKEVKPVAKGLRGKTIISKLHRLEIVLEYDRILVLESGRVAHFGSSDEVIWGSRLFSLFSKQYNSMTSE